MEKANTLVPGRVMGDQGQRGRDRSDPKRQAVPDMCLTSRLRLASADPSAVVTFDEFQSGFWRRCVNIFPPHPRSRVAVTVNGPFSGL